VFIFTTIYLVVDIAYVVLALPLYRPMVRAVQGTDARFRPAFGALAYIGLVTGWICLVVPLVEHLADQYNKIHPSIVGLGVGTLYGFTLYGVYNGTVAGIFDKYDGTLVLIDMVWGIGWNALVSALYAGLVIPRI
jgi:uncharacterized membrane protein